MTKRLAARIGLLVGLLLVGVGSWLLLTSAQSEEVARIAQLPVVKPAAFSGLPNGADALVEGSLLPREPLGPQDFVVYTEQYFLRKHSEGPNRGREEWGNRAVPRPLVALEREGHVVELCSRDYQLVRPLHAWQADGVPRSGDLVHEATLRRAGFKARDALIARGRALDVSGRRCLEAKALFGGDHAQYLEYQRGGVIVLYVVGGVFCGLGVLLLGLSLLARPFSVT